jgi:hypothetical protein
MPDKLARMLAHPLRQRVLFEYQSEPTTPARIARRLDRSVNLISYHTRVLVQHGCLTPVRTQRRRGALEHFYCSTVGQVVEDDHWEAASTPLRRALVLGTLRTLEDEARAAALVGGFDVPGAVLARAPLELDDEGMREVSRVLRRAYDEIEQIAEASRGRSEPRHIEVALLAFERNEADGAAGSSQAQRRQTGSSSGS